MKHLLSKNIKEKNDVEGYKGKGPGCSGCWGLCTSSCAQGCNSACTAWYFSSVVQ